MNVVENRRKILKIFIWLLVAFVGIFLLRWGYEVYFSRRDVMISYTYQNTSNISESVKSSNNVATDRISQKDLTGQNIIIDQKYEKTANLSSTTTKFKDDDQKLRQVIKNNEAVIQSERLSGLEGSQTLIMTIGVKPDNFDEIVAQVKEIGDVTSFAINKVDKTDEYRSLLAEQSTLEKTRDSYIEIKKNGGNIQDLLAIESKILEVEKSLQDLGVNMGVFSTEYSFCTVNLTLNEKTAATISIRYVLSCAKSAFIWTFLLFLGGGFAVLVALTGIWLILLLLDYIAKYTKKDISAQEDDKNK